MGKIINLSTLAILLMSLNTSTPKHYGKGGVMPVKAYTQNILGKNVGYYVEFKNGSKKSVDALEWKARFYNNFVDLKGTREGNWSSGNFIKPIEPNTTTEDLEGVWVDGATKVFVIISRVHYTDGTSCTK
jgi:hypothetical protein